MELDFESTGRAVNMIEASLSMVENTLHDMPSRILSKVYDRIGFNAIDDDILRQLVIARICQPMSKCATVEYIKSCSDGHT